MPPETRYARSGDVNIAYQVVGDRPLDLVLVQGWVLGFDAGWEDPSIAHFYRRLSSFARLILFDKRGTGLSDRVAVDDLPDLETRIDDVRAVLDSVGSEEASLFGVSEGGPMCALFAATYPERTRALVMGGSFPRRLKAPDYPIGLDEDEVRTRLDLIEHAWPKGYARYFLERNAPTIAGNAEAVQWYARTFARGASPAAALALAGMNLGIDIRSVLRSIRVPTLVLYRAEESQRLTGEYLGRRIPGAKVVVLPGRDHLPWVGDQDAVLDEVEEFLTGARPVADLERVLATVLFIDIVRSTELAAEVGDRRWRELLEQHDEVVQRELDRFRGREVDRAGDGVLATFDGPARAVRCAVAIRSSVRTLGLVIRAGVHTGEVELGDARVTGIAVHTGARVVARAAPGEVLVSGTVRDLVAGSGIEFADRGTHELKGVPGEWRLYAVSDV